MHMLTRLATCVCHTTYVYIYLHDSFFVAPSLLPSQRLKELSTAAEEEESQEDIATYVSPISHTYNLLLCPVA